MRNFEQRGERGAAVAVYRDGRKVVDLWAGTQATWTAPATLGPGHRPDRPLGHQGRGRRRTPAPAPARPARPGRPGVARTGRSSRPRGKERTLVRHLLAHRAGVPALDRPLTPAEAVDGESGPARGRRAGPGLGARHRARLPRADLQLAARRAGPARHRAHHRPLDRRGDRRPARPGLLDGRARRRGAPGGPGRPRRAARGRRRRPAAAPQADRRRGVRRTRTR